MNQLETLKEHREQLLLAELSALLHDVGKLSSQFIDQMSTVPSSLSQNFEHESALIRLPDFVNPQFVDVLRQRTLRDKLRLSGIPNHEQLGQLLDLIFHHDSPRHSAFLVRLLNRCDGSDSGADKGTTRQEGLPRQAKQEFTDTFIATAFGDEMQKVDPEKLDNLRINLTAYIGQLNLILSKRSEIFEKIKLAYVYGLAETRRSANDVTLWCHSFSVATLYKTSLATFFLNRTLNINHLLRWRLLRVNFDVLGLYAKAIKIADLLGYKRAVEEVCEQVKQLMEEEYPLGNEVYRDTTGIYFTFPDIDLPVDLAQEISHCVEKVDPELAPHIDVTTGDGQTVTEQLKGILAKAHSEANKALEYPFDSKNLSTRWGQLWMNLPPDCKWELCPVCRLRPMKEGEESCQTCLNRRSSRIKEWLDNIETTIWMDEIADHNDRVALLIGKFVLDDWLSGDLVQTLLVKADPITQTFIPKNPSPARLRRVWETCQRFWTECVQKDILYKHDYGKDAECAHLRRNRWLIIPDKKYGWKENVPYDGTINGKPVSLFWREEKKHFTTIINLQLVGDIEAGHSVTVSNPKELGEKIIFIVQDVDKQVDYRYIPFLPLVSSPDQFLALVPAVDVLDIAKKIHEEYAKQFGKVQNRLPLFLGIVFFPRKLPLLAVMNVARRMLEAPMREESWTVEYCGPDVEGYNQYLHLSQCEDRLILKIPIKMGDKKTDDIWYPYFFVEHFADDKPNNRPYRFQHNGRWLVHVSNLIEGDVVKVTPSRFAYLWLENTARRFEFDLQKDVMLLEELPRLMEIWKKISKIQEMTDTKLRGVWTLLKSKGIAWGKTSDEFQNLVKTTLKREGMLNSVEPEDVINGRFERCLELYIKILKQKVKED